MSEKDTETKAYMRENTVFADAFNYLIYNGRNVIHPEELQKFSTSLREVLGCIKYPQDKEQLSLFMKDNPRMKMETNAARVIRAMTNIDIDIPEEAEEVDMCKAIEDMIEERSEERELKGREEGRKEGVIITLIGLVRDGFLTKTEAACRINMTESAFEEKMRQMS